MEQVKNQIGTLGTPSDEQLNHAFRNLHDLMTRTFVRLLLLGETAKTVKEGQIQGEKIEAGIKAQDLKAEYVRDTLIEWVNKEDNPEITDEKFSFTVDGVPVIIKIIKKKWNFLKDPDLFVYRSDEVYLPNPFNKYWPARFLI